jgi:hypothetical protein
MAVTVLDVITDALRELGVIAQGETATNYDADHGLSAINRLIDQWAAERMQIYAQTRTTWAIVSGTQVYTVGTGGTVNLVRPVFLDHIHYLNTGLATTTEFQLQPLTDDAWSKVPIKDLSSPYPTCWYYNPTFPLGTLTLWPNPSSATLTGVMYAPTAVAEFTALTTAISLPPGYRRMLVKNLALEMAPSFSREVSGMLAAQAADSLSAVKRSNKRMMDMSVESAALIQGQSRRHYYNIYTG